MTDLDQYAATRSFDALAPLAQLEARDITAWFADHMVLEQVSLTMKAGEVTSLIGPSGCGKSTFLRILNRMHQMIPSAAMAGEVLLDGKDIYDPGVRLTQARRDIGMVFQKPNPFPAMSIYDNVTSGLKLIGGNRDGSLDALADGAIGAAIDPDSRDELVRAVLCALAGEGPDDSSGVQRFRFESFARLACELTGSHLLRAPARAAA